MIVSTKTAEEILEQIQRRMKEVQAAIDRMEAAEELIDDTEYHFMHGQMCGLRYVRNIIELRYL